VRSRCLVALPERRSTGARRSLSVIDARLRGDRPEAIARGFHLGFGRALAAAARELAEGVNVDTVVLSGGVIQNQLLLGDIRDALAPTKLQLWLNRDVPPNDGGISIGQASLAVYAREAT